MFLSFDLGLLGTARVEKQLKISFKSYGLWAVSYGRKDQKTIPYAIYSVFLKICKMMNAKNENFHFLESKIVFLPP